ncbi:MAG: elongation factor P [Acidobacteria bacterium 13_1_40CM_4_69_4]|nr:MAG: elongation factor P [Acidobacteria bacterium 13_1_40CM_4_69_4]
MIPATQLRSGMAILHGGNLCRVLMRNLKTGNSFEYRFRSEDRVEKADLEEHEMEFLYAAGEDYHFMNTGTYEQVAIGREDLGDAVHFLVPNIKVMVEFYEHRPVGVELPVTVDLRVVETAPGMKGATASNSGKPAVLETGLQVVVPQFIDVGELVRVDTAEGKYLERAK